MISKIQSKAIDSEILKYEIRLSQGSPRCLKIQIILDFIMSSGNSGFRTREGPFQIPDFRRFDSSASS
jgi:hypothetical protein